MLRIWLGSILSALGLGGIVTSWVLICSNNARYDALIAEGTTEGVARDILQGGINTMIIITALIAIFGLMLWAGFVMLTDKDLNRKSTDMWILTGVIVFCFATIIVCICSRGTIVTLRDNTGLLALFASMMLITLVSPFVTLAIAD